MDKKQAQEKIESTFESPFDKDRFASFIRNLLNYIDESRAFHARGEVKEMFKHIIKTYERLCTYTDPDGKNVDIIIAYLQKGHSLDHARVTQRNFAAKYLSDRGEKEAGLFAFVSPDEEDWRFSLVKMDYRFEDGKDGKVKVKEEFTPARRWSFLVGANEKSHTAKRQLVPIMAEDEHNPTLAQLEEAFSIEKVAKEFFEKYRNLFFRTKDALDRILKGNATVASDFQSKQIDTVNFVKKLLGQIVFLYFIQKKGWLGVPENKSWGEGDHNFLRNLFRKSQNESKNFSNDYLEFLLYDALNQEHRGGVDPSYYHRFECKIPFLNGGLFTPDYDWGKTQISIPNEVFSDKKDESDEGNGILDVFDLFNFTVKEDEPLEKEVAIDPEFLGKIFEKFNAINPTNYEEYRKALKSKKKDLERRFNRRHGVYYTPGEIVHYMCQESLINYLSTKLEGEVAREHIEQYIRFGLLVVERERTALKKLKASEALGKEYRGDYRASLDDSIRRYAPLIDRKLSEIRVCDPAVGSGAFPVGMMTEIVNARITLLELGFIEDKHFKLNDQVVERNKYNYKRDAIQNSLYGVDIDLGAAEIAKLRLWLSLIVDEQDIRKISPLPNLDYKIVCGNSLVGIHRSLENWKLFEQLEKLKPSYLNETDSEKKRERKRHIDGLISEIAGQSNSFDFELYFSEIFHEKGGFDVVVGNPPYLESRSPEFSDDLKDALRLAVENRWGTDAKFITRGADLLIYFFELGIYTINKTGNVILITENSWLDTEYGKKFQNFLMRNTRVRQIIDSDFKYFDSSTGPNINTLISIFQGKTAAGDGSVEFARFHENFGKIFVGKKELEKSENSHIVEFRKYGYEDDVLEEIKWGILLSADNRFLDLLAILKRKGTRLNRIPGLNLSLGQGLNLKKEYCVDKVVLNEFEFLENAKVPFMTAVDGAPFELTETDRYLIDESKLTKKEKRLLKRKGIKPFDPSSTKKQKPILIMPRGIGRHFCCINAVGGFSASMVDVYSQDASVNIETLMNLWLFLNSSVAWLIREMAGRKNLGGGMLKAEATDLKPFPVFFEFGERHRISDIYNKIRPREALDTLVEIETFEHKQIDEVVFDHLRIPSSLRKKIIEILKDGIVRREQKSLT